MYEEAKRNGMGVERIKSTYEKQEVEERKGRYQGLRRATFLQEDERRSVEVEKRSTHT